MSAIRIRTVDRMSAREIRRRLLLDHCKWDPQVGDRDVLPPYALVIDRARWLELASLAEALASELVEIESKLATRHDLDVNLGIPKRLRRMVRARGVPTPTLARTMRFDFHPLRVGFGLSEVNADVPGGFTEASFLPALVGEALGLKTVGDPGRAFIDAAKTHVAEGETVALVSAPGFMEDHQVVTFLARAFEAHGRRAVLGSASRLGWNAGRAQFAAERGEVPVDAVVRFYQAEWIASIREATTLGPLFVGGRTPVTNPLGATLTENKRLPLLFDALGASALMRRAFPETRDARTRSWRRSPEQWVLKKAYSNTGDAVFFPERLGRRQRALLVAQIAFSPSRWLVQRRFHIEPVDSPDGPLRACIGVFTIDGVAAGAYARVSPDAIINHGAMDVALLVD